MLTTGLDNLTGTAGEDVFVGGADAAGSTVNTLSSLDAINGGAGKDTLKVGLTKDGSIDLPNLTSVEVIEIQGAANADVKVASTPVGVTNLNVTQAVDVDLTAGATTAVAVSGATGAKIEVKGGSDVVVTSATKDQTVAVGGIKGAVTVTATKEAGAIAVDAATYVTVVSTVANIDAATIDIGKVTPVTGAVVVTQSLNSDGVAAQKGGAITTTGGTTVTINVNATSTAKDKVANEAITVGAITANAGKTTTAITVNQNDTATVFVTSAKAAVVPTETVKFEALAANKNTTVGGLTFTAAKNLTAAEVAAAFANLTALDTQSAGGLVTNGAYAGKLAADWTSAAASGDTVVFTGSKDSAAALVYAGDTKATSKVTAGTAAEPEAKTTNKVTFGDVTVKGTADKAVTAVTLNGYAKATVTDVDGLTTLSLTDSGDAATVTTAATTLALTVNNVKNDVTLTATKLATLNLTTAGKDSAFKLGAADTKTLAVTGDKAADLTGSTLTSLTTVTVAGTAGLTLDDKATAITSINTTGTTGAVTATIDGSKASYTGGAGVDTVTLTGAVDLTKAIDLGAGDDTLSFGVLAVKGSKAAVAGGEGTDTLSMSAAAAAGLDDAAVTFVTGFERLTINDAGKAEKIDLANLGFTNYVTTTGSIAELNNLGNNGTVVVTTTATELTVAIKDAATGKADALNVELSSKGALAANKLTVANVETVNVTSTDTDKEAHVNALELTANKATTIKVSGNAGLDLTLAPTSTLVTLIDGSASTGDLKASTSASAAATTVKGGAGADNLTASHNQDVLEGGAGKDTLSVANNANLVTLRGGAGQDTYVIGKASNSNGYATIDGAAADLLGDVIQFGSAVTSFSSAKIVLGSTAVFQDYANEAAKAGTAGAVSWFQWASDTYLVQDNTTGSASFSNTADAIVKLVGTSVNFSFNSDQGTPAGILEII